MVLDTETNSDDYKIADIIESGFAIYADDIWDVYQELHKPETRIIPPKVESICYITNAMVQDKPPFAESKDVFQQVVDQYSTGYLVAHNHFFDMRVLERHGIDFKNHTWICTWRLSKKIFAAVSEIEETNLPYLRFALSLDIPISMVCHRAGNDSFITAKLLEFLVTTMEDTGVISKDKPYGPQIAAWCAEPIIYEKMPFGKYKGVPMKDIPHSYWKWAMNNTHWFDEEADNFDPDLLASINIAIDN